MISKQNKRRVEEGQPSVTVEHGENSHNFESEEDCGDQKASGWKSESPWILELRAT